MNWFNVFPWPHLWQRTSIGGFGFRDGDGLVFGGAFEGGVTGGGPIDAGAAFAGAAFGGGGNGFKGGLGGALNGSIVNDEDGSCRSFGVLCTIWSSSITSSSL